MVTKLRKCIIFTWQGVKREYLTVRDFKFGNRLKDGAEGNQVYGVVCEDLSQAPSSTRLEQLRNILNSTFLEAQPLPSDLDFAPTGTYEAHRANGSVRKQATAN
jgi:hypothetical protein